MRPLTSILAAVLSLTATCASAQLYKWVDDNGVVNYGDSPPAGVRVQPVTHGTVSSVSGGPRQQVEASAQRDSSRRAQRAPREINETMNVSVNSGAGSSDDPDYIAGYAPYYAYPRREVARAADAIDRRRPEQPIAKPILPVDPAIPEMPGRLRR